MKFYHATHKLLVPMVLREGLKPNKMGIVYVAKSPQEALFTVGDGPPLDTWRKNGIHYGETESIPREDLVLLEIKGLKKGDISFEDDYQWEEDIDLAARKYIPPSQIRVVGGG